MEYVEKQVRENLDFLAPFLINYLIIQELFKKKVLLSMFNRSLLSFLQLLDKIFCLANNIIKEIMTLPSEIHVYKLIYNFCKMEIKLQLAKEVLLYQVVRKPDLLQQEPCMLMVIFTCWMTPFQLWMPKQASKFMRKSFFLYQKRRLSFQ